MLKTIKKAILPVAIAGFLSVSVGASDNKAHDHSDPNHTHDDAKVEKVDDAKILESVGLLTSVNYSGRLNFSKAEKAALLKGFSVGMDSKEPSAEMQAMVPQVQALMQKKMQDAKSNTPPAEPEKEASAEDLKVIEALGLLSASQLANLAFNKTEKASFLKGFEAGLKLKEPPAEIKSLMPQIQTFMQAKMIAQQKVEDAKMAKKMETMVVPMETELVNSQGEKTSLAKLVKGNKAILLDFWASWCGPCMQLMPKLKEKAEKLAPQKIIVAGMNTESIEDAEKIRKEKGFTFTWLVEPKDGIFSKMLGINSIPRMILLTPEGKVLFNGHPSDAGLIKHLEDLGAKL